MLQRLVLIIASTFIVDPSSRAMVLSALCMLMLLHHGQQSISDGLAAT